jgi:electron transport complex protein RnfE
MERRESDLSSPAWLAVALAPALAVSDLASTALVLGVLVIAIGAVMTIAGGLLKSRSDEVRWILLTLLLTAAVSSAGLLVSAWRHDLYGALSVFLPLLAANLALQRGAPAHPVKPAFLFTLTFALVMLILGLVREFVGRGSLFHDAHMLGDWASALDVQLFRPDMGFLLAMLPPGAFIAFGLLLAARNWMNRSS